MKQNSYTKWIAGELEDVATLTRGISWSKSDEDPEGIPVIAIPNVKNGAVSFDIKYRIRKKISETKKLNEHDILLVGSSGSIQNVGRAAMVKNMPFPDATFASFLVKAIPNENMGRDFLYFLLGSSVIRFPEYSKRAADGKYNLQVRQLTKHPIKIPPKNEQAVISQLLYIAEEAKSTAAKVIAATQQLKQSLMHHVFTYGPVPVDEAENIELQETEIGVMPSHWEIKHLGEVTEKPQYGLTASAIEEPIGPRLLRITDIQGSTVAWSDVPYTDSDEDEKTKYALQPDDILVARIGATTGKSYLVRDKVDSVFASYLMRLRAKEGLLPEYLYQFMQSTIYWQQINASKGGRLKQGINIPVLQNMLIPYPPNQEQETISNTLSACDKKTEAEKRKKNTLDQVFNSLLDHLMTGKVRVDPNRMTA